MREQRTPSQEGAAPWKWELERRRRRPIRHNTTTPCIGPLEPRKRAVRCGHTGLDSRRGPTVRAQLQPQSGGPGVTVDDQCSHQSAHVVRSDGWPASARARTYRLPGQPGFEAHALGRS